jgi:fumarate hydratase class II
MNANEVIAHRANELLTGRRQPREPVHPNDHVNLGQSSNDAFPTAIHLAVLLQLDRVLLPALETLRGDLAEKAREFDPVLKLGRTHLQDAVPVRLGQEFAGYARMVERSAERLAELRPVLEEVALGGTAAGTGVNTHPEFAARTLAEVNARTGLNLRPAVNFFEALGSRHGLVAASGVLKILACDLMKIANDLRLTSSGPRGGLAEIVLPALQPGSSMMPGKVNPVIPEAVCQVAARVIGNDAGVAVAGGSGLLELNVMMPFLADAVLESVRLLGAAARLLAEKCVRGIRARPERCRRWLDESLALTTALVPRLGYDAAAKLAQKAEAEGTTLRAVAERDSGLSRGELDRLLDPSKMLGPGFSQPSS